jgi:hypothetical protein
MRWRDHGTRCCVGACCDVHVTYCGRVVPPAASRRVTPASMRALAFPGAASLSCAQRYKMVQAFNVTATSMSVKQRGNSMRACDAPSAGFDARHVTNCVVEHLQRLDVQAQSARQLLCGGRTYRVRRGASVVRRRRREMNLLAT